MSRIGRAPITVPSDVTVKIEDGNKVTVKGPKGELTRTLHQDMSIKLEDGVLEISTDTADLHNVREALEQMGYAISSAEAAQVPATYTRLEDPDSLVKMGRLLDALEDNDDVSDVYHNWEE